MKQAHYADVGCHMHIVLSEAGPVGARFVKLGDVFFFWGVFRVFPAYRQGSELFCSSCLSARQCAFMFFLPIGKAVGFSVLPAYRQGSVLLCSSCLSAWQ